MSKAILLSIKPKYVAKILNGEKTIEIRKTMPKCDLPIDVYIYCTKEKHLMRKGEKEWLIKDKNFVYEDANYYAGFNGKVVAKFTVRKVEEIVRYDGEFYTSTYEENEICQNACLSLKEIHRYLINKEIGYAYHIEDLVIFDRPKELADFWHYKGGNLGLPNANTRLVSNITKAPQNYCFVKVD